MPQLGLTAQPMQVVIGVLTALSGFEIFYAAEIYQEAGLLAANLAWPRTCSWLPR
jgi:hypothetical protein